MLDDRIEGDFSYNHRSITDDELSKIKERIDNKIARRQQQATKSAAATATPPATTTSNPLPATTFSLPEPVVTAPMPTFNNDEYSIFRDVPASRPEATTVSLLIDLTHHDHCCFLFN